MSPTRDGTTYVTKPPRRTLRSVGAVSLIAAMCAAIPLALSSPAGAQGSAPTDKPKPPAEAEAPARSLPPGQWPKEQPAAGLGTRRSGKQALDAIRAAGKVDAVAARNGKTPAEVEKLLATDETAAVDADGSILFVDPGTETAPAALPAPAAGPPAEPGPYSNASTFLLHSRPGSERVIYLDFNGATLSGTAWNGSVANGTNFLGFSLDGDSTTYTQAEHDAIQSIWQRVAEDYAPFDVDVTTQEPPASDITRSGAGDTRYGTRALITNSFYSAICSSCGGIAYIGVFDEPTFHAYYQPALVFASMLSYGTKNIAEATSHEVGHNLGLNHDGRTTPAEAYYQGHGAWAPIMGVGYYRPIVQWSRGEYANANNTEDDFGVMATHGLARPDENTGTTCGTAAPLGPNSGGYFFTAGVIQTSSDFDWFSFTADGPGNAIFDAGPYAAAGGIAPSPNLDIWMDLINSSGTVLSSTRPAAAYSTTDVATGMAANTTFYIPAAGTYCIRITGDQLLTPSDGYSYYGSVGRYYLQGLLPKGPTNITATAGATQSVTVAWSAPAVAPSSYRVTLTPFTNGVGTPVTRVVSSSPATFYIAGGVYLSSVQALYAGGPGIANGGNAVNNVGTPGDYTVSSSSGAGGVVSTSWTGPSYTGGTPPVWIRVGLDRPGRSPLVAWASAASSSLTLYGVPGGTYTPTVAGYSNAGIGKTGRSTALNVVGLPSQPETPSISAGAGAVQVSWSPPTDTGGSPLTYYRVNLFTSANTQPVRTQWVSSAGLSATFSNPPAGTLSATVAAYTSSGGLGPETDPTSSVASPGSGVPDVTLAAAPTAVVLTPAATGGVATVSWNAPSITGSSAVTSYRVTLIPTDGSSPVTVTTANTTTSAVIYAPPAGTYYAGVQAINGGGLGAQGRTAAASAIISQPGPATGLSVTPGPGNATVTWNAPTDNGGSAVTFSRILFTSTNVNHQVTAGWVGTGTSAFFQSLPAGTYTVTVEGANAAGLGLPSAPTTTVTVGPAPAAGTAPTAEAASSSAKLLPPSEVKVEQGPPPAVVEEKKADNSDK